MSQENVEVVRQAWEAFVRRDNDAAFALYDAEVEIHSPVDGRVYRGLDGVREYNRDWLSVWDDFGADVEEWVDAGDDEVAIVRWWGRGKHSGVPVELTAAHLWTLRNRKLWRFRVFPTKTEALDAVGLSGQEMSQENVEIVRRMFEAYSVRQNRAALQGFDPDVEFDITFRPDGGIFHGREGVAEAMRIWTGTFDEWMFHVEELIDAGSRVLVVVRESGRGKGSGVVIEQATFLVATLRNDKVIRMKGYLNRNDALEAVGLSE